MIKVRPAGERGKTRTDWLDSNHTFSFNRYHDPQPRIGTLVVALATHYLRHLARPLRGPITVKSDEEIGRLVDVEVE